MKSRTDRGGRAKIYLICLFLVVVMCAGAWTFNKVSYKLNPEASATYAYYFAHIKPAPDAKPQESKKGWICTICGYIYEGEDLPADFICPVCKHPASDFKRIE